MAADVQLGPGTGQPGAPYGEPRGGAGNGGRYDDHESRLRRVEEAVTRIEAHMEHLASREFIYRAILAGLGLAAAMTVAITRLLP